MIDLCVFLEEYFRYFKKIRGIKKVSYNEKQLLNDRVAVECCDIFREFIFQNNFFFVYLCGVVGFIEIKVFWDLIEKGLFLYV